MLALPDSEHDGISDFLLGLFKENSTSLRAVLEALRVLSLSKGQIEKISCTDVKKRPSNRNILIFVLVKISV